jgi:hypothetical protein
MAHSGLSVSFNQRASGAFEEIAESCDIRYSWRERHLAGAEAQRSLCSICGTTEVVPCYKARTAGSFPERVKARDPFMALNICGF